MAGSPAPRSSRAGNVSPSSRAPVVTAIRLAASSPGRRTAVPPSRIRHGSPLRSALAAAPITSPGTGEAGRTGTAGAGSAGPDQDTSAGRISVAIAPAAAAAATASAASPATSALRSDRRTHPDTDPASASMSDSSGASSRLWKVAWSPTTFTSGVPARRALCRLASPLARPGPRCSSVPPGHPPVPVRRASRRPLEQAQHAPHLRDRVQRRHEVHLRGARVAEAHLDTRSGQRPDQRLRTIHPAII